MFLYQRTIDMGKFFLSFTWKLLKMVEDCNRETIN